MAKKDTRKNYQVNIFAKVWIEVPVKAASFEEAVELGRKLALDKVFENPDTNWIDYSSQVSGVHEEDVVDL